jgi:hypothetical protein
MVHPGRIAAALALIVAPFAGGRAIGDADTAVLTNGELEQLGPGGFPVDWGQVGETVTTTSDAHSGKVAFRLLRTADTAAAETGINRRWEPDSGEQGAMLDRRKGGIVFWYKAVSQAAPGTLTVQIIPMSARPWEDTGAARVVFQVPESDVGDGRWHRGAVKYDFTASSNVKWVHISPRLLGAGELLLDDFSWVEKVGPLLRIETITFTESKEAPGREATIVVEIGNRGDEPTPADTLTGAAPQGLQLTPVTTCQVPPLNPDETHEVKLALRGARYQESAVQFALTTASVTASLPLHADAALDRVELERFIIAPGERTKLRAVVANTGRIILRQLPVAVSGNQVEVAKPGSRRVSELPPGRKATLEWAISPKSESAQTEIKVRARLPAGDVTQRVTLVSVSPGEAMALGDGVRTLEVRKTGLGWGLCLLKAKGARGEHILAKMPYLARLVFVTPEGSRQELPVYAQQVQRAPHALILTCAFTDTGGANWHLRAEFGLTPQSRFALRYSLEADQPRSLLAFDGPMVYVAEGTGAARRDGLFPGLEWLVADEESSSDLDIAQDHADRLRYVPHPNKVTIPLMSLRTDDGLVALLWDPHQKWDGERDRPAAVFATPDRFEGRASHLMGLALPSVPEFIPENQREAQRPYPLRPGRSLTLTATLLAEPEARDALVAQDAWVEQFGIPDPMPYPRGALDAEIAFSAGAYVDSLWLADKNMWLPFKGGPGIWMIPSRNPAYAYDLVVASLLAADAETRQACKQRLDLLLAQGPLTPSAEDLGFDYGRAEQGLASLLAQAAARIDSQGADGAWRFDANRKDQGVFKGMDYHELGPDQAAEIGTCARAAYEILLAARMSGDAEAYAAGVRALKFMDQFTVPRAAQVWEVPVHTPDVLAAADAVDAYLEAYRMGGDRHWLDQAVKWARAGLPFIYLWNTPEYPFMRYASIPVLGASWFKWSWFGRAVQWNGLRYGYALLKLAEYDATMPWRKIAQGVTVSAMYQQAQAPPDVGLWPDSISLIDAGKSGWIFAPQQILKNIYYLLGRPAEPQTRIIRTGERSIHISSGATISGASFNNSELHFHLEYPRGKVGTTAVVGVTAPQAVEVDGAPAPELPDATTAAGPAYRYVPAMNLALVRIAHDGAHDVKIIGVAAQSAELLPRPRFDIAFDFDAAAQGWSASNDLAPFEVMGGTLATEATGNDPYMTRSRMRLDGSSIRAIVIRMAATGGESAQFYWATEAEPFFAESRVVNFPIQPDGQFHQYRINVGDHPQWRGHKIVAIRLDPTNGAPGAKIRVDYIKGEGRRPRAGE